MFVVEEVVVVVCPSQRRSRIRFRSTSHIRRYRRHLCWHHPKTLFQNRRSEVEEEVALEKQLRPLCQPILVLHWPIWYRFKVWSGDAIFFPYSIYYLLFTSYFGFPSTKWVMEDSGEKNDPPVQDKGQLIYPPGKSESIFTANMKILVTWQTCR